MNLTALGYRNLFAVLIIALATVFFSFIFQIVSYWMTTSGGLMSQSPLIGLQLVAGFLFGWLFAILRDRYRHYRDEHKEFKKKLMEQKRLRKEQEEREDR